MTSIAGAVDLLIVLVVLGAIVGGWRQGAVSSVISAVGIAAGLVVGLALTPVLLRPVDSQAARALVLFAVVVCTVGLGNLVGITIGGHYRNSVRRKSSRTVDSVLGALLQAVAVTVVVWFISIPLAASVPGAVGEGIRNSKVLAGVDAVAPDGASKAPAKLAALLDDSGLPPLVSPFNSPQGPDVAAPDGAVIDPEMVARWRPSVVHVMGDAESCRRRLMGSGFVIAPDYVATNAHVVAGTERVSLDTVLGVKPADVVFYDPDTDIAVLHAAGLGLDAMEWADAQLGHGDDAVVMGFPQSGPFEAAPARVRGMLTIAGPDIYTTGRVERETYTIRAGVRQGNSGGPLVTPDGQVAGMIFGASMDARETGYVLTARQVRERVGEVAGLTRPVGTGGCVAG